MKIAFLASPRPGAQEALEELVRQYGQSTIAEADYVITLGGDGTFLKALHALLNVAVKPVFPMRTHGSIGFLCNPLRMSDLGDRLYSAVQIELPVLQATVERVDGQQETLFAINEIVLVRQRLQQARFKLTVDDGNATMTLAGDGLALVTPIGSTGYNFSLGGPRLPLGSQLLVLTGIAVAHRNPWHRAVLTDQITLDVDIVEAEYHPVRIETAIEAIPDIRKARLSCNGNRKTKLLLEQDVLNELTAFSGQFLEYHKRPF
ncbi:NAD(+)/NADH kinase [Ensifer adhaerens]|uniref:NAD(+)/NADH kinase n=2 Tax=Ensifer TaxID=106591 RepID=UPI000DC5FB4C|nr:NAD(+)/NADH kinase [Ensifer adhaerens]RAS08294.1 NAD+ kinase [Ensifer adhaerens]